MSVPLISTPTKTAVMGTFIADPPNLDVFQVFKADGSISMHMNANGSIDPPIFSQVATITLTSAQLKALHTTSIQLIPPPTGVGFIVPVSFSFIYNAGTIAYTITGSDDAIYLNWAGQAINAGPGVGNISDTGLNTTTSFMNTQPVNMGSGTVGISAIQGQAVNVGMLDVLTLGNGTLTVACIYNIVAI